MSTIRTVFGVQWVEVEFGERDEGWNLFADRDVCIQRTKDASARGVYDGGYIGPERPLRVYEIPFDCLTDKMKDSINENGWCGTPNNWRPKFRDSGTCI